MAAKKNSAAKKKSAIKTSAPKKSATKKSATKTSAPKTSAPKTSATNARSGKGAAKKTGKQGRVSQTFADAGAKMDQMLARGQKRIRGIQSKVVEIEEKSRAFLADASSSPAIKKIRNMAKKASPARKGQRAGNGSAQRKSGKKKGQGKAAKVVSTELSKLGATLKDVFTPNSSPSDAN